MKIIKNGKKYDTDTAKEVGSYQKGYGRDLSYYREELYRKKTGEFFLYGEGGPASKYAESCGNNSWSGGCQIIPLTYEAARIWAEKHLDADEYEAVFGEVSEDDSRTAATLSLSVTALETAKRAAAKNSMNLSAYIETLILAAREDA